MMELSLYKIFYLLFCCSCHLASIIPDPPRLLVISFDGFRHDYMNQTLTPNIYKLAKAGVVAPMKPSFVTKTFPNHQSIATGFYEETHGIINNEMFDPVLNATFEVTDENGVWWDNGVAFPLWLANQEHSSGKRFSGSMMWPGSHVSYRNKTITYMHPFDRKTSWHDKIDIVVDWMTRSNNSANCVFAYFPELDETAHSYGPWSTEVLTKVGEIDDLIKYLMGRLKEKNIDEKVNFILLSDHGMSEINADRVINLDTFISRDIYELYGRSPVYSILPKPGHEQHVYDLLKNASENQNFTVYYHKDIPAEYHYSNHRRILDIFIVADEGYDIFQNMTWTMPSKVWGNHGYNNSLPSMMPLFVAKGPAFRSRHHRLKSFSNVDLFPLMCNILGLQMSKYNTNGSFEHVFDFLASSEEVPLPVINEVVFKFLLFIAGGFALILISSFCFVGCNGLIRGKKPRTVHIEWDPLASGLNIDLNGQLRDIEEDSINHRSIDDRFSKSALARGAEETVGLLQLHDEEV